MEDSVHCSANYVPLSPITFIVRAAIFNGDKASMVYGSKRFTWKETYQRCLNLASALVQLKISGGDIVAALAPNVPELYELHFGVAMAGAVLCALNTKLDETMLASILEQLQATILFVDYQYTEVVLKALGNMSQNPSNKLPLLVLIPDCDQATTAASMVNRGLPSISLDYDGILQIGTRVIDFQAIRPRNEFDPISVNYTSGSTGIPKGAVYSHRAAYLNSIAQIFRFDMRPEPVLLWTVDMFRCNGWCLPWTMAALGGTNICIRNFSGKVIFDSIIEHKVTHICGPPSILNTIANAPASEQRVLPFRVNGIFAGVMPNSRVLEKVEELGFNVFCAYGMTEVLGPVIVRPWKFAHNSSTQKNMKCSSLGLYNLIVDQEVDVKDSDTMTSVPNDGTTVGEIMFRGNNLMLGYLRNPELTDKAFADGWYRTGDLGIKHVDGWIQIKDRTTDAIVSRGGEIISTLEVESVLLSHPQILEAAVVGKYHDEMRETTICAFVKLKQGSNAGEEEIIKFCEDELPHTMVPKTIVFKDLPYNSTGKIQKFILREKANAKG